MWLTLLVSNPGPSGDVAWLVSGWLGPESADLEIADLVQCMLLICGRSLLVLPSCARYRRERIQHVDCPD